MCQGGFTGRTRRSSVRHFQQHMNRCNRTLQPPAPPPAFKLIRSGLFFIPVQPSTPISDNGQNPKKAWP